MTTKQRTIIRKIIEEIGQILEEREREMKAERSIEIESEIEGK